MRKLKFADLRKSYKKLRKSANHKKYCVRKTANPKLPHLRKIRKYNKFFKSENLRICDLRNLFAERPPVLNTQRALYN
jgi:hypothetical protein